MQPHVRMSGQKIKKKLRASSILPGSVRWIRSGQRLEFCSWCLLCLLLLFRQTQSRVQNLRVWGERERAQERVREIHPYQCSGQLYRHCFFWRLPQKMSCGGAGLQCPRLGGHRNWSLRWEAHGPPQSAAGSRSQLAWWHLEGTVASPCWAAELCHYLFMHSWQHQTSGHDGEIWARGWLWGDNSPGGEQQLRLPRCVSPQSFADPGPNSCWGFTGMANEMLCILSSLQIPSRNTPKGLTTCTRAVSLTPTLTSQTCSQTCTSLRSTYLQYEKLMSKSLPCWLALRCVFVSYESLITSLQGILGQMFSKSLVQVFQLWLNIYILQLPLPSAECVTT